MAEKLRYDVEVNTRDGVRELDKLGQAGKDAGKDIEAGFEGAESATDQVIAAMMQMGTRLDSEMREAAAAADLLKAALGEAADRIDATEAVAEFRKIGLSARDVIGDVDKLAAALKELDAIKTRQVSDGVSDMGDKLKGAGDQATNAKGALANMIGNTAQDVTGLSNSLGVAIGQMAEYSADALLAGGNTKQAFKEMALIAGPIAGLAALQFGIQAVTGSIADWRKKQEAFVAQQRDFNESVRETGSQFEAISQMVEDSVLLQPAPEMNWMQDLLNDVPILGRMLDDTADSSETVAESMAAAGITTTEWFEAMRVDIPGGIIRFDQMNRKLLELRDTGRITGDQYELLSEQFHRQGAVVAANAVAAGQAAAVQKRGANEVNAAWTETSETLARQDALWQTVIADMADGTLETVHAVIAYNQLQQELGLTEEAMDEVVRSRVAEELEAQAEAAEETALQYREARLAAAEYASVISGVDWGNAALQATETVLTGYVDQMFAVGDALAANEEAYEGVAESLKAADEAGLSFNQAIRDVNSPEGRAVRASMRQLADAILPDIQRAYDDADGDQQAFYDNMATVGSSALTEMQRDLGLTTDEANDLAHQIGLTPEMVQTTFELIGEEEAKLQLGLMQGLMDTLTEPQQAEISMLILEGDYVGARNTMQTYLTNHPVTAPVVATLDTAALEAALRRLRASSSVKVGIDPSPDPRSVAPPGGGGPPVAVPYMGDVAPVNVYVNAPRGTRPDDLVRAGDRYARRNGRSRAHR